MEKIKENKQLIIINSILILLPILVGVILWDRLPEQMATHFDGKGAANGWSSREFAVLGLPILLLGCHLLCAFVTATDPKANALSGKIYQLVLWICPVVSWFGAAATYSYELGAEWNVSLLAQILIAVLFIVLGSCLPKCPQNYTVGIKLPWTLNDEENWNKTHRMAGVLWMACGAVMLVCCFISFFAEITGSMFVMIGVASAAVLIPAVYSLTLYLKKKKV